MTQYLPPTLLALFAPRPPVPYLPPPEKSNLPPLTGVAAYLQEFETDQPAMDGADVGSDYPFTKQKRKERKRKAKSAEHEKKLTELAKSWDPHKDEKATADPYKTLFVARMAYDTTEHKLRKEFEHYGAIHKIRVVQDQEGKPKGYGFVEFEREKDMRVAYKQADGRKIDGRRIVVDVERGRTVRNWKPRRLGGGLGFTRAGADNVNQKYSGREPSAPSEGRERSPVRSEPRGDSRETRRFDRRDHRRDDRSPVRPRDRSDRSRGEKRERERDRRH